MTPSINPDTVSASRSGGDTARRICIPIAVDRGCDSKLLNHFGSAPLFAIVDVDSGAISMLANGAGHGHGGCAPVEAIAAQGVEAVVVGGIGSGDGGCAPVEAIAAQGVEAVVVGGIGSGAIRRLAAYGIQVLQGRMGPISILIEDYKNGALAPWDPTVACADHGHGHHGEHGGGGGRSGHGGHSHGGPGQGGHGWGAR